MGFVDVIIMALVIALVAFTIVYNVRKAKKGGGCSGCDGCSSKLKCGHNNSNIK